MTRLNKALSVVIGLAILGAIAFLVHVATTPPAGDKFTEFYLLGSGGKAADYPVQLKVGEVGRLTLVIVNREQEATSYRVEIRIDGVIRDELGPMTLEPDEKYEQPVTFAADKPGVAQRADFLLYKQGQNDIYNSLYLLFDVTD